MFINFPHYKSNPLCIADKISATESPVFRGSRLRVVCSLSKNAPPRLLYLQSNAYFRVFCIHWRATRSAKQPLLGLGRLDNACFVYRRNHKVYNIGTRNKSNIIILSLDEQN